MNVLNLFLVGRGLIKNKLIERGKNNYKRGDEL